MNTLRRIVVTCVLGVSSAFGSVARYLGPQRVPIAVFGSLLAVILGVSLFALANGGEEVFAHVWQRNVEAHWGWGTAAYILFGRLLLVYERKRRLNLRWWWFYSLPYLALMACVCFQEFWPWAFPKLGDFHREGITAGERWKSLGDLAGWSFGAIPGAWAIYFMAERYWHARADYLRWKADRSRRSCTC